MSPTHVCSISPVVFFLFTAVSPILLKSKTKPRLMLEIPCVVFFQENDSCHSVSAGGFDNLVHVRQFSLAATWISDISYNLNASLEDLFPW